MFIATTCSSAVTTIVNPPVEAVGSWFVLRTRSRHEKILAGELSARGIANFLPLITCTKYYGGRKVRVELPMFQGYLFLRGSMDQAYEADRTDRVAQIICVPDQRRLAQELRDIELALRAKVSFDPYPYLQAGVRVEVRDGPFRGLRGVIESRDRTERLILQIQILGRAVSL